MAAVSSAKPAAPEVSSKAGSNGHASKAPVPEFSKDQELVVYRDMLPSAASRRRRASSTAWA